MARRRSARCSPGSRTPGAGSRPAARFSRAGRRPGAEDTRCRGRDREKRWGRLTGGEGLDLATELSGIHSVTFLLAALGVVEVRGALAEPVIAATIIVVAAANLLGKGEDRFGKWRLPVVFALLTLVHRTPAARWVAVALTTAFVTIGLYGFLDRVCGAAGPMGSA
ncbi:HupE/UreJ family protein [Streptomyces sp. HYC2]|uniref:HupE/UreJ family protein n=1 Tax=Streptomyces sp. HYC2 TaxID=2955207 RepID=UPI002480A999|nr:HupE/UreJ family protein [Streptomyces sp. HYC2]